MGDVARNKLGQNNATYVQPFGNMDGAPAGIIFHLVISVITASNSSCLIRKRNTSCFWPSIRSWYADPTISVMWALRRLFHSYNSHFWLQPKRKGNREKLLLTSRRILTHLASKEEAKSRARSLFSQTSLVVYATAIHVPVVFSGNVFNLEVKNYIYGRGKL